MEKTLEALFLKNYEELQNQLELANKKIVELMQKKEEEKEEIAEKPVFFKTFSKEVCKLDVQRAYNIRDCDFIKNLNSNQIRDIIEDKNKLIEYSKMKTEGYFSYKLIEIEERTFPYTAVIRGKCILFMLTDDNCYSYILGDKNKLEQDKYYDIKEKKRLYEFGLEKLKEEFQIVYEYKLKKEKEEQENQEEK